MSVPFIPGAPPSGYPQQQPIWQQQQPGQPGQPTQPGQPQAPGQPPGQPPTQPGMPPQQPPAPPGQPQPGYPPPGYPQQQPMGQSGQPVDMRMDTVLQGPAIPRELRGRTMAEAIQLYGQLKSYYVQKETSPAAQPMQQPVQQQAQPVQQQQQAQQAQQPQRDVNAFYRDPWNSTRQVVQEAVREAMAPIAANSLIPAIQGARQQFLQFHPEAAMLSPQIEAIVAGMPPEAQASPDLWRQAYHLVLGQQAAQQQAMQRGYNPQPSSNGNGYGQTQNQSAPGDFVRVTPQGMFFSESSTPSDRQLGEQQIQLTQQDYTMAQKFGQSPEVWAKNRQALSRGEFPHV